MFSILRRTLACVLVSVLVLSIVPEFSQTAIAEAIDPWVTVNDQDASIYYTGSGWINIPSFVVKGYFINDDLHVTSKPGDSFQFTFTGGSIRLICAKNAGQGMADIYIDGAFTATVDNYGNGPKQVMYENTGLNYGEHTVRVVNSDSKNPYSNANTLNLDAYEYRAFSNSTINPVAAQYDKVEGSENHIDLPVTVVFRGEDTLVDISKWDYTLQAGQDYIINENIVTIKKEFLQTLQRGKNTLTFTFSIGEPQKLVLTVMDSSIPANANSFSTGGITLTHKYADEGLYFDTPADEVAYALAVMRTADNHYYTIYHSEAKKSIPMPYAGDGIKTGIYPGAFDYVMPTDKDYRIYSHPTDTVSVLYSPEVYGANEYSGGGAGNPMVVRGSNGDPYCYMFFVGTTDVDRDHDINEADFGMYLCVARSLNMRDWELKTELPDEGVVWKPFTENSTMEERRPFILKDTEGNEIRTKVPVAVEDTIGLLGSISCYNGNYYFFYTDRDTDGNIYLFFRTVDAANLSQGLWSAAERVTNEPLPTTLIKVAKARGMDKWVVLYNGYRLIDGIPTPDLFMQYTDNMNVVGEGGISSLKFYDYLVQGPYVLQGINNSHYLDLVSGSPARAQQYYMIDEYGNLTVPDNEDQSYKNGGMLFWTDAYAGIFGANVYRARWDVYDDTAPVITVNSPASADYNNSFDLTPQFDIVDGESGVDNTKTAVMLDGEDIAADAVIPLYTLPLGDHAFTITAYDPEGNSSTASVSFRTITSIDALKALVVRFENEGLIDNGGIANSLLKKLEKGNLKAFINEVKAQKGKHITAEASEYLIRDAQLLLEQ